MFKRNKGKKGAKHKRPSFWSREKLISVSLFGAKKPDIAIPDTPPPAPGLAQPPRVAVVLGGGGARGFAHVGVLKILQEAGIPIDLVVGTSVGSLIGALFCDNHKAEHLEEEIRRIKPKDLLDLAIFRLRSGIFTGNALQNFLLRRLQAQQFNELKTKLVVTAVDISTSDVISLESGPIAPAVNASCALPPFFHPVDLYGYHLVDGGIIDPVPVAVAKMYQPKIVVAVDVTPGVVIHWPRNLLTRFVRSYNFSLAELGQLHARQSDIIIAPKVGDTDIFDFTRKMQMYEAGIQAAQQKLYDLKQAISQKIEIIP